MWRIKGIWFIYLIEILFFLTCTIEALFLCLSLMFPPFTTSEKFNLDCSGSWENDNLYGLEQLIYALIQISKTIIALLG